MKEENGKALLPNNFFLILYLGFIPEICQQTDITKRLEEISRDGVILYEEV